MWNILIIGGCHFMNMFVLGAFIGGVLTLLYLNGEIQDDSDDFDV